MSQLLPTQPGCASEEGVRKDMIGQYLVLQVSVQKQLNLLYIATFLSLPEQSIGLVRSSAVPIVW